MTIQVRTIILGTLLAIVVTFGTVVADSACDPCAPVCNGSRIKVSGFLEAGIIGNSHGAYENGGTFLYGPSVSRFNMNQLCLSVEREMDASKGLDWGGRFDLMYGMQGLGVQSWGDESFDYGWNADGDYGAGFNQLYVTLGYKKLSVNIGKFITPIGWEGTLSWNNFFYSHSNVYYIEPCTHNGVLASYAITDRLTVFSGWTAGMDNFVNRFGDSAFLGGFEANVTKTGTLYYYLYKGRQYEGVLPISGNLRNRGLGDVDYFLQSICYEWNVTDRLTYLLQYDLNNCNLTDKTARWSAYGINNHLLYRFTDKWAAGLRFEWMRDNGGVASWLNEAKGDYYQYTLGLNWNPTKHLRIRPEIRYDIAHGVTPFGKNGDKSDQFSGGFAVLWGF